MAGYVYLIGSTTFGWYKIGKSITPETRIKNLGILLPFKIEVLAVWRAENHTLMESTLHEMYSANRINGEWFQFTKKEVWALVNAIPNETRVLTKEKFSNIEEDRKGLRHVTGLKTKMRASVKHNLSPEECERRKLASIEQQRLKKLQKSGAVVV